LMKKKSTKKERAKRARGRARSLGQGRLKHEFKKNQEGDGVRKNANGRKQKSAENVEETQKWTVRGRDVGPMARGWKGAITVKWGARGFSVTKTTDNSLGRRQNSSTKKNYLKGWDTMLAEKREKKRKSLRFTNENE